MRVYLAGAWSDRDAVRRFARQLGFFTGCEITEPWWDKPAADGGEPGEYLRKCGEDDLRGVRDADVLVFMHHEDTRGAWLEMGYALALGKPVVVADAGSVRVRFSPFCYLPTVTVVGPYADAVAGAMERISLHTAGRSATWPK